MQSVDDITSSVDDITSSVDDIASADFPYQMERYVLYFGDLGLAVELWPWISIRGDNKQQVNPGKTSVTASLTI